MRLLLHFLYGCGQPVAQPPTDFSFAASLVAQAVCTCPWVPTAGRPTTTCRLWTRSGHGVLGPLSPGTPAPAPRSRTALPAPVMPAPIPSLQRAEHAQVH